MFACENVRGLILLSGSRQRSEKHFFTTFRGVFIFLRPALKSIFCSMRTRPRAADQSTTIVSHAQLDVQIYHFTGGQLFFFIFYPVF